MGKQVIRNNETKSYVDDEREALLGIVVGKKGVGKTHNTLIMLKEYVMIAPRRRVLIIDVNGEFSRFPEICLSEVKAWCQSGVVEVRRITVFKKAEDSKLQMNNKPLYFQPNGKMSLNEICNALYFILENFYGGLLLVEDINKYISDSLPNDLIGALCTQRHVGTDVIIHFQMIGKAGNPKIIANCNWIRVHKVFDKVQRHESKFGSLTEPLLIIEKMVDLKYAQAHLNNKKGVYKDKKDFKKASSFHVFWDADEEKIKGNFSKLDFVYAITQFLEENYKTKVNPKLKETSLFSGGNKYQKREDVIRGLINNYIADYYGN